MESGLVAFRHQRPVDLELWLELARTLHDPPVNVYGKPIPHERLVQDFENKRKRGLMSIGIVPNTMPERVAPVISLTLTRTSAMAVDDESNVFLNFGVLEKADPPFAVSYTPSPGFDLDSPRDVVMFLDVMKKIIGILRAEYAFGGNPHDFVDDELVDPLSRAWPLTYLDRSRADRVDLTALPPQARAERTADGGLWITVTANPFVDFPRKKESLEALFKALRL